MDKPYEKELTIEQLASLPDSAINTSDIAELGTDFWNSANLVIPEERNKSQITAKFDTDMVDWFKQQGRGYQARMNAVLRAYFEAKRG